MKQHVIFRGALCGTLLIALSWSSAASVDGGAAGKQDQDVTIEVVDVNDEESEQREIREAVDELLEELALDQDETAQAVQAAQAAKSLKERLAALQTMVRFQRADEERMQRFSLDEQGRQGLRSSLLEYWALKARAGQERRVAEDLLGRARGLSRAHHEEVRDWAQERADQIARCRKDIVESAARLSLAAQALPPTFPGWQDLALDPSTIAAFGTIDDLQEQRWQRWAERFAHRWQDWADRTEVRMQDFSQAQEDFHQAFAERTREDWEGWAKEYASHWEDWATEYADGWESWAEEMEELGDSAVTDPRFFQGLFENLSGLEKMPVQKSMEMVLEQSPLLDERRWQDLSGAIQGAVEESLRGLEDMPLDDEDLAQLVEEILSDVNRMTHQLRDASEKRSVDQQREAYQRWRKLLPRSRFPVAEEEAQEVGDDFGTDVRQSWRSVMERARDVQRKGLEQRAEEIRQGSRGEVDRLLEELEVERHALNERERELDELKSQVEALRKEVERMKQEHRGQGKKSRR